MTCSQKELTGRKHDNTMLLCHLPTVECGPFDVNADKEYAISMFGKNPKLAACTNLTSISIIVIRWTEVG
jgi:hypothetical protein